jgi:hypothetical protein
MEEIVLEVVQKIELKKIQHNRNCVFLMQCKIAISILVNSLKRVSSRGASLKTS